MNAASTPRPDWVVTLSRQLHGTPRDDGAEAVEVLAGRCIASITDEQPTFSHVSMTLRPAGAPLRLSADLLQLRCSPMPLPPTGQAPATSGVDHVVHMILTRLEDPESIERFLARTTGIIDRYWTGREVWLEVLSQPDGSVPHETEHATVDDVFVARYPTAEHWRCLNDDPRWRQANEALISEAAVVFDLLIVPSINRIADHR